MRISIEYRWISNNSCQWINNAHIELSNTIGADGSGSENVHINQFIIQFQRADMYISYHLGDPFFVQIPSIDRWSNATLLVQPLGDYSYMNRSLMYYIRIYTSIGSVGRIQLDNVTISALIYHRIAQTDYYYYEQQMSNVTHCISAIDANVKYSVR